MKKLLVILLVLLMAFAATSCEMLEEKYNEIMGNTETPETPSKEETPQVKTEQPKEIRVKSRAQRQKQGRIQQDNNNLYGRE